MCCAFDARPSKRISFYFDESASRGRQGKQIWSGMMNTWCTNIFGQLWRNQISNEMIMANCCLDACSTSTLPCKLFNLCMKLDHVSRRCSWSQNPNREKRIEKVYSFINNDRWCIGLSIQCSSEFCDVNVWHWLLIYFHFNVQNITPILASIYIHDWAFVLIQCEPDSCLSFVICKPQYQYDYYLV